MSRSSQAKVGHSPLFYPNFLSFAEEMFNLEPYKGNADQQETKEQFDDFVQAVGLCDMHPKILHNAGILTGTTPPRMGIIDFDCRKKV